VCEGVEGGEFGEVDLIEVGGEGKEGEDRWIEIEGGRRMCHGWLSLFLCVCFD